MKLKDIIVFIVGLIVAISIDFTMLIYGSPFVKTAAILLGIVILIDLVFIALMWGSE